MAQHPLIGQPMPAFALPDATGQIVQSAALVGQKPLVIYFYPRDDTPGCTQEAHGFRDAYDEIVSSGAQVVGISPDTPASHGQFAERHQLPFTLLSDPKRAVFRAFGVRRFLGLIPGRETFVVDTAGIVRFHLRSNVAPRKHVEWALAHLRAAHT